MVSDRSALFTGADWYRDCLASHFIPSTSKAHVLFLRRFLLIIFCPLSTFFFMDSMGRAIIMYDCFRVLRSRLSCNYGCYVLLLRFDKPKKYVWMKSLEDSVREMRHSLSIIYPGVWTPIEIHFSGMATIWVKARSSDLPLDLQVGWNWQCSLQPKIDALIFVDVLNRECKSLLEMFLLATITVLPSAAEPDS